jgi:hypothetical protein
MNETKIQLSEKEMDLVTNADIILTKNAIIKKAISLLETVQDNEQLYLKKLKKSLPKEVVERSPKISKGENYKGLPYLVLDYPRVFKKESVFAIRTLFWWGNFFSITLHLSGNYKSQFEKNIAASFEELKDAGFSFCINNEEWEHHFEEDNYLPLSQIGQNDYQKNIKESRFIKLAKKIPLQDWDNTPDLLIAGFKRIIELI